MHFSILHWFYQVHLLFLCILVKKYIKHLHILREKSDEQMTDNCIVCHSWSKSSLNNSFDYLKFSISWPCHYTTVDASLSFYQPFFKIMPLWEKFSINFLLFLPPSDLLLKCTIFLFNIIQELTFTSIIFLANFNLKFSNHQVPTTCWSIIQLSNQSCLFLMPYFKQNIIL